MKRNLFGNNIEVNCSYCSNYIEENGGYCDKNREIKKGKCRKFTYNPLLRIPKSDPIMMQFSKEDFEL